MKDTLQPGITHTMTYKVPDNRTVPNLRLATWSALLNLSHAAPTVPGSTVTVDVKLTDVDRRALTFEIEARDEHATISTGTHQRGVVNRDRFESRLPR